MSLTRDMAVSVSFLGSFIEGLGFLSMGFSVDIKQVWI